MTPVQESLQMFCEKCELNNNEDCGPWPVTDSSGFKNVKKIHHNHLGWKPWKPALTLEQQATKTLYKLSDSFFEERELLKKFSNLNEYDFIKELEVIRKELVDVIERSFENRYFALEVNQSVKTQLMIEGLTLPFMLINMGDPSTFKTTILDIVNSLPDCYKIDKFSPKSFVSHSANTAKNKLKEIDLLPKIKHRTVITPELAPLFSGDEKQLLENLGLLTLLLDGHGLETESGVHGHRGYTGDYYFMWLGAVVDIPHKIWKILGTLGFKIYFLRLPKGELDEEKQKKKIIESMKSEPYQKKVKKCQKIIQKFWLALSKSTHMNSDGKIVWNKEKDDQKTIERIIEIAILLSKLRGVIPTWYTEDSGGSNYHYEMPTIENPIRASDALYNLARGHAILYGRNYITKDDLVVVIPVALSSATKERVALMKLLIENNGQVNTEQFENSAKVSKATALKNMEMLRILGLCETDTEDAETKPIHTIKLKEIFKWFLSQEFKEYWDKFTVTHTPKNSKFSQRTKDNLEKKDVCVPVYSCSVCGKIWNDGCKSLSELRNEHIHGNKVDIALQ